MILFPNCKINLGLHILRKRIDGYHELETIFYPIPVHDVLEAVEMPVYHRTASLPFTMSGIDIKGNASSNLCVRAYRLLKRDFPQLPHVMMHLHKTIPSGAGLGGGSADAAFTLKLLNEKFNLGITQAGLIEYALELGSDCPFFIINKPCYATGRGEILEPVELDLSAYKIIIINPGLHVNTSNAFMNIHPAVPSLSLKETIQLPVSKWKELIENDFEHVIFQQHPEIGSIKNELYESGAIYSAMSGSGSTVFGIFEMETQVKLEIPSHYFYRELISQR
jgi:4-diphosphocytidyl-2-C-methyl-D-erythritol kinase